MTPLEGVFLRSWLGWLPVLGFVALCVLGKTWVETHLQKRRQDRLKIEPLKASFQSESLRKYSLGFDNLLGAMIWVDLLQSHSEKPLESDEVSWEFQQVHSLISLDRKFISAYRFGAVYLSVLRRDQLGAKIILEKWHRQQPERWNPLYMLGYHLYYEMGRFQEASEKILQAASMPGAPYWLTSLGVRLLSEAGAMMQAMRLSVQLFDELRDEEARDRLKERIRALNFALQKAAWADALQSYRKENKQEPQGLTDLSPYFQRQVRELASVPMGGAFSPELASYVSERFEFRYDRKEKSIVSVKSQEELGVEPVGTFKTRYEKQRAKESGDST